MGGSYTTTRNPMAGYAALYIISAQSAFLSAFPSKAVQTISGSTTAIREVTKALEQCGQDSLIG